MFSFHLIFALFGFKCPGKASALAVNLFQILLSVALFSIMNLAILLFVRKFFKTCCPCHLLERWLSLLLSFLKITQKSSGFDTSKCPEALFVAEIQPEKVQCIIPYGCQGSPQHVITRLSLHWPHVGKCNDEHVSYYLPTLKSLHYELFEKRKQSSSHHFILALSPVAHTTLVHS